MRHLSFCLILFLLCNTAHAHLVSTRLGEFYSGLLHPIISMIHIVPWLALALLAAFQKQKTARWNLLLFPLAVLCGTLLGGLLPQASIITDLNSLSIIALGILLALALQIPLNLFLGLAILIGLIHGYANGLGELSGNARILYISGVTTIAYIVITLFSGLAYQLLQKISWSPIALRALGGWITAVGLIFSGYQMMSVS